MDKQGDVSKKRKQLYKLQIAQKKQIRAWAGKAENNRAEDLTRLSPVPQFFVFSKKFHRFGHSLTSANQNYIDDALCVCQWSVLITLYSVFSSFVHMHWKIGLVNQPQQKTRSRVEHLSRPGQFFSQCLFGLWVSKRCLLFSYLERQARPTRNLFIQEVYLSRQAGQTNKRSTYYLGVYDFSSPYSIGNQQRLILFVFSLGHKFCRSQNVGGTTAF